MFDVYPVPPIVTIESPYAGDVEENVRYARECLRDSLLRGEAPFASHLLYTQVLDDLDPNERAHGMRAGMAWGMSSDKVAVYEDLGISPGMRKGIELYTSLGITIEYRKIR